MNIQSIHKGLSIQKFSTGYSKKIIVKNLNIPLLPAGKVTALLGPNGCGKSTFLRALAGLNKAAGALVLNQDDLMKMPFSERAAQVVYLPQSIPDGIHLHVFESIIVAKRASKDSHQQHNMDKNNAANPNNSKHSLKHVLKDEIMEILEQLGIAHLAWSYLDQLSGGQKQLVGLAQSLVRKPQLLLLDEPLSALDLNYQFHVMDLVKKETQKRNIVTVVVLHDINIALRHADHIIMLKDGDLIANGDPKKVITPENIAQVYGVKSRVEKCSLGTPQVLVDGLVNLDLSCAKTAMA